MITFKIPRIRTAFEWGVLFMLLKAALSQSVIIIYSDWMDNVLVFASLSCLVISILQDRYPIRTLIFYCITTLVSLYSVVQTGNYGFLITFIICLALRGKELNKFFYFIFKFQLYFLVFHTVLAVFVDAFGGEPLMIYSRGATRCRFGFTHPNFFSVYLFNLLILWTWLNYDKVYHRHLLAILGITSVATFFTDTRTSFLLTCLFCALIMASKSKYTIIKNALNSVAKIIIPVSAILTLLCVHLYLEKNAVAFVIDALLSSRIKLGAYGLSQFGYTLLGQDIRKHVVVWDEMWRLNGFTFDNLYTYLAINQGFLWIVVLSVLFYLLSKKKNPKFDVFVIVWSLYGITEIHGINGFYCFPIFLLALLFDNNKTVDEKRKIF